METMTSAQLAQLLYVAYYGRPADSAGQQFWAEQIEAVGAAGVAADFGASAEFTERFGELSNEELINNLYQQLFGRDGEQAGIDYWLNLLESGTPMAQIALEIANGAQNDDVTAINNKVAVAQRFTDLAGEEYAGNDAAESARDFLMNINAATDVDAVDVQAAVDALVETPVSELTEALNNLQAANTAKADFLEENEISEEQIAADLAAAELALSGARAVESDRALNARVLDREDDVAAAQAAINEVEGLADAVATLETAQANLEAAVEAQAEVSVDTAAEQAAFGVRNPGTTVNGYEVTVNDALVIAQDESGALSITEAGEELPGINDLFAAHQAQQAADTAVANAEAAVTEAELEVSRLDVGEETEALAVALEEAEEADQIAQANLAAAQGATADATAELEAAQAAQDAAETGLADAEMAIDGANANVEDAETALDDANTAVADAQTALDDAQTAVDAEDGELADANAELADANTALEEAEATVTAARGLQAQYDPLDGTLADAEDALDAANAELTDASADLDAADAGLADAEDALDAANDTLADASDALDTANVTLADAGADLDAADAELADASAALDAADAALETANDAASSFDGLVETYNATLSAYDADTDAGAEALVEAYNALADAAEISVFPQPLSATQIATSFDAGIQDLIGAEEDALADAVDDADAAQATAQTAYDAAVSTQADAQTAFETAQADQAAAQAEYDAAVTAQADAQTAFETAQADQADAQTAYDAAVTAQADAQTAYDDAAAALEAFLDEADALAEQVGFELDRVNPDFAALLNAAIVAADQAEQEQQNAVAAQATAQGDFDAAVVTRDEAQGELTAAQEAQATAQTALNQAIAAQVNAETAVQTATAELDAANARVEGAQTVLETATANEATAQETADVAAADLTAAQEALNASTGNLYQDLLDARANYEAALEDLATREELISDVEAAQANADQLAELNANIEAAQAAFEELGFELPIVASGDVDATAENDVFLFAGEAATISGFGGEGEDLLFFGEGFNLVALEEGQTITNRVGDSNELEIFWEQQGNNLVLFVENETFAGNATNDADITTVVLEGFNAEGINSFEDGYLSAGTIVEVA